MEHDGQHPISASGLHMHKHTLAHTYKQVYTTLRVVMLSSIIGKPSWTRVRTLSNLTHTPHPRLPSFFPVFSFVLHCFFYCLHFPFLIKDEILLCSTLVNARLSSYLSLFQAAETSCTRVYPDSSPSVCRHKTTKF